MMKMLDLFLWGLDPLAFSSFLYIIIPQGFKKLLFVSNVSESSMTWKKEEC